MISQKDRKLWLLLINIEYQAELYNQPKLQDPTSLKHLQVTYEGIASQLNIVPEPTATSDVIPDSSQVTTSGATSVQVEPSKIITRSMTGTKTIAPDYLRGECGDIYFLLW